MSARPGFALYAQHLTQELPVQDSSDPKRFDDLIEQAAGLIESSDAVVVGAGSGLSSAAGYDFYLNGPWFEKAFSDYGRAHGFSAPMDGLYHLYSRHEQRWAFLARFIQECCSMPVGKPYRDLADVLASKEHFVITTNVDGQFARSFDEAKVCYFQGDLRYLQCCQPCHDEVVPAAELAEGLVKATVFEDGIPVVPSDLVPRCPYCGRILQPWVRDESFLEGPFWKRGVDAYERFLREQLAESRRVLFMEIGVGGMTPSIIEIPFWRMAASNDNAAYLRINMAKSGLPVQLQGKGLNIAADAALVLDALAAR